MALYPNMEGIEKTESEFMGEKSQEYDESKRRSESSECPQELGTLGVRSGLGVSGTRFAGPNTNLYYLKLISPERRKLR